MALTGTEETDLLLPLFNGIRERAGFRTFLTRLMRRTEADYASLILRAASGSAFGSRRWSVGIDLEARARDSGLPSPTEADRQHLEAMRIGRVYSIGELIEHDPMARGQRAHQNARLGIGDERVVRMVTDDGANLWLMLARTGRCSAADAALLSSLSSYVAVAAGAIIGLEREQRRASVSAQGLAHSGMLCMGFDPDGHLVELDDQGQRAWAELTGTTPRIGERLRGITPAAERELASAITAMRAGTDTDRSAVLLSENPRLEAVLLPLTDDTTPNNLTLALVALPHYPSDKATRRLAQLHALPRREAELAMALANGQSIAEAAASMGLTTETARNYSKKLYSKLGVRGQVDLVRLIWSGTAMLV